MRNIKIIHISFLCGALCALSCMTQQPEVTRGNSLVLTNPNNLFPNENYLIAVGTGDSRKRAENQAVASLAQIFESEVIVDTQSSQTYRSVLGNLESSQLNSEIIQTININTEHNLINVRFSEAYRDENDLFHIIAFINRNETGIIYRDIIQMNNLRVNKAILDADEADGLIQKYTYVQEAMAVSIANEILIEQVRIISPRIERIVRPNIGYTEVEALNRDLLSRMVFRIFIEGDDGGISSHVSEELSSFGFSTSDSGDLQISGSLIFENAGSSEEYETVLWRLNLSIVDSDGVQLFTINETNRERALDRVTAEFLARETIKEIISEIIGDSLLSVL